MLSVLSLGWNLFVAVGERFCCCGGVFLMVFGVLFVFFCLFWYVWITWAPRGAKAPPPLKKVRNLVPFGRHLGAMFNVFAIIFSTSFCMASGRRFSRFRLHFGSILGAFSEPFWSIFLKTLKSENGAGAQAGAPFCRFQGL
jgi:hypothetical protein